MEITVQEQREEFHRAVTEVASAAAQTQALQNAIDASGATFVAPSAARPVVSAGEGGAILRYGDKYRENSVFGP